MPSGSGAGSGLGQLAPASSRKQSTRLARKLRAALDRSSPNRSCAEKRRSTSIRVRGRRRYEVALCALSMIFFRALDNVRGGRHSQSAVTRMHTGAVMSRPSPEVWHVHGAHCFRNSIAASQTRFPSLGWTHVLPTKNQNGRGSKQRRI